MSSKILALAVVPLVALGAVAATAVGSSQSGDETITICHVPPGNSGQARTMDVPRSSWSAHQGHGDTEGPCPPARSAAAPPPAAVPPMPPTRVSLSLAGDGDLDGDASFEVTVANSGDVAATGLRIEGRLQGEGHWKVRGEGVLDCKVERSHLSCRLADLPASSLSKVRITLDGPVAVCREIVADLSVTARNDESSGDDHARESVRAGACSPLDRGA